jgi:predicted O-linked N-acetylglucosamine transferase (SPINDLY family)
VNLHDLPALAVPDGDGAARAPSALPAAPAAPPGHPFHAGRRLAAEQRWAEAAEAYAAAIALAPQDALLWLNLAHALLKLDAVDHAAAAARQAVALDPGCTLGLTIAAQCLARADRQQELALLLQSADLDAHGDVGLHLQLAAALTRLARYEEAIQACFGALRCSPRCAEAFAQLGSVFQLMKMPEEARESFRNALALGGSTVGLASAIVFASLEASSWPALTADLAALEALVEGGAGQPMPFYCLTFPWTRHQQLAASRAYAERLFADVAMLPPCPPRAAHARIRVGYVSSDFHAHATAYLMAELFERHDRDAFDVFAYSYGDDDGSPMRRRLMAAFGPHFVDARALSDPALAERIRRDRIDVLVDLKGYTLYARNRVFGHRPAPIQVNYLGFPGSLGSPHYDYIIGDPVVTPLAHADGFSEKIAQLPRCYQPNDRQRRIGSATDRRRWGLPAAAFVFCSFNANYKITPEVFDRWCSLLRQVDDAVLWLFETNAQARRNLQRELRRRGIDPGRLFWAPGLNLSEHLARIQVADLFLDTLPVNAHTTASDALWAGLPVLTVRGESFVARVAASLLEAAGLPELIADDLAHYERIALDLARDRGRLAALRERLAGQREHCALFDSAQYTRDLEALFVRMVARHDQGLAPGHLAAAPAAAARAPARPERQAGK